MQNAVPTGKSPHWMATVSPAMKKIIYLRSTVICFNTMKITVSVMNLLMPYAREWNIKGIPNGYLRNIRVRFSWMKKSMTWMLHWMRSRISAFSLWRADVVKSAKKKLSALYYIGRKFNLPRKFVEQVIQNVKEQYSHRNVGEWDPSADAGSDAQDDTFDSDDMTLEECYDILDCKPGDSRIAVKQAYRLKCKCNHPDKVKAFGGTEKDVLLATERIKVINKAYARIKDFRCWT